jgi:hypothetical protein
VLKVGLSTVPVTCGSSYSGSGSRRILAADQSGQKWEILSEKQTKAKRARGLAQVEHHLPSKSEVEFKFQYYPKKFF